MHQVISSKYTAVHYIILIILFSFFLPPSPPSRLRQVEASLCFCYFTFRFGTRDMSLSFSS